MNTIAFAWRFLWSRPLAAGLNVLLLSLGLASLSFVLLVSHQIDQAFERDLAGIDVVVGAKGSPMQLILSGVFHIDAPTGNVPLAAVKELEQHPHVAKLIPLSLGDSLRGFRIVGTTPDYLTHYQATFAQGSVWTAPMQAVLGAQVAKQTGLKVGDRFAGSHGLAGGGDSHGQTPYVVSGVLAPGGSVLDRLVLTALDSVWQVHEDHTALDADDRQVLEDEREITLALIQYRTPLAAVTFPRFVNSSTEMQAAAPALEITRLLGMIGVGTDVLRALAGVLLLTAGLSVFIALWSAVRERRADLALLRLLGAPPRKVAALLLCEALWLALLATVIGVLAGQGLMALLAWLLQLDKSVLVGALSWPVGLVSVPVLAVGVALLSALLPAYEAYRVPVFELLQSR
ncbi:MULTISPECIES: FtsX-like permease family protein [unclassified Polaromonas]|jgi:putative ABC transport system permease protein|uniref:ABC transporter permease n=1 Tax=unclassified Polaromonas TaxID=2638319 RepID=UPI000BC88D5F|nr:MULTISPECIES: FtsX-like permease family protein [unclassified Polaromonas]OYY37916.1 MAG: multidrug ABC transporter substrate-binding protein [Polaromonas sp. 35-63-35]OYZ21097.1 MAG: multidrug ABC transporter substrate-binding protein [Polaromonas sp. 16-63-31]OYZ79464.1 MAG: multidrug ABC transporter substrate-binding protein [Polaromonas sp. 24-63-21]OZA50609.1 MAG: multidrug ABC transporter substrate-binding protein [Polaromonas sp. 17-63-33]OZA89469.1 MAG: multidrug ABC transporter sub